MDNTPGRLPRGSPKPLKICGLPLFYHIKS